MFKKLWGAALLLLILVLAELFSFSYCDWSLSYSTLNGRDRIAHTDFFFRGYHISSSGVLKRTVQTYRDGPGLISWPPLYYVTFGFLMKVFTKVFKVELLNWFVVYFPKLVLWWIYGLILWGIGKRAWPGPEGGLLALSLLWLNPEILNQTFRVDLDLPALVAMAAATFGLLNSDDFQKLTKSSLFGLLCGLALLTKASTYIFITGLYIAALLLVATSGSNKSSIKFRNLLIAALVTGCTGALFYGLFFSNLLWYINNVEFANKGNLSFLPCLSHLASRLALLHLPILVVLIFSTIFLILEKDKYLIAFIPIILIVILYFSCSILPHSEDEVLTFTRPLLIVLVILIIQGISLIPVNVLKSFIATVLILFGMADFAWNYIKSPILYARYANIVDNLSRHPAMNVFFHYAPPEIFISYADHHPFYVSNLYLLQLLRNNYLEGRPNVIMFQEATKGVGTWSLGYVVYKYPIPPQSLCNYSDPKCIVNNISRDTVFFIDNKDWCTGAKSFFLTLGHEVEKAWYISSPEPNPNKTGFCIVRFGDV